MNTRQKEERQMDLVFQPTIDENDEITELIKSTIRAKRKVWLVTDLHLFVRIVKDKNLCKKRNNFNEVITNQTSIHPNDLVINLGDLVDGEFTDQEALKKILLSLPGNKILVRGNNDIFTNSFYKSCGFQQVVYGFKYDNIAFTHVPIVHHNFKMNIHGHIHGYKTYWVPYNKHIDVFNIGRKPILLHDAIASQPDYAKSIKVQMDKFVQESSIFDKMCLYHDYNINRNDPYTN